MEWLVQRLSNECMNYSGVPLLLFIISSTQPIRHKKLLVFGSRAFSRVLLQLDAFASSSGLKRCGWSLLH